MKSIEYMTSQIRFMCAAFCNRTGGSGAERACQDHIQAELGRYADTVSEQEITVHPDAGWAWIVAVAVCGITSIILPLFNMQSTLLAVLAFALSALAVVITVFHFLLGFHMLDRFLPKRKAKNVFAAVKPIGSVQKRIVFVGHADAAYEFTYSHRGGAKKIMRVAVTSFVSLAAVFLLNMVSLFWRIAWLRMGMLLLIPFFMEAMFFFNIRCVVDGANDNLSGCVVSMATLKALSRQGNRLENTEVCCLTTSSEESGLRGAHAFARQYARENDGVDTLYIALDTLHDTEQLMIYTHGMNGFQKNSPEVAALLREAGSRLGLALPDAGRYLGATDAEAFSRAGLKACALCGVDHTPQPYYHTRADRADNIDDRCLKTCLDLCLQLVRLADRQIDEDIAFAEAV